MIENRKKQWMGGRYVRNTQQQLVLPNKTIVTPELEAVKETRQVTYSVAIAA